MTTWRGVRIGFVGSLLLLATACAQSGGESGEGPGGPAGVGGPDQPGVALRVDQIGGFLDPADRLGRLPIIAVYASGEVITQGPQVAIYPGPALPNLQLHRIAPEDVDRLIARARDAGVRAGADLGRPSVADAPSTRFTLSSASGTEVLEVYALGETDGLTEAQRTAREKLRNLLTELTEPGGLVEADRAGAAEPYRPEGVAAVATPWRADRNAGPAGQQPEVAWPGPALPGASLPGLDVHCVEAHGADADAVLAAAEKANANTPWTAGGKRWQLRLRPLLPDEAGCADLPVE